ncbi:MAG: hypothetical protein JW712_05460 [Dehalococcoidales bacterium]|nr:hypothetical protein [Dehalococcoidales bacterium]
METYNIRPQYSTNETIGRCLRCAAENEMNNCLMHLLSDETDNDELAEKKFQALVTFLKSPDCQKLIDESERLMSEGKNVNVRLYMEGDTAKYELIVS